MFPKNLSQISRKGTYILLLKVPNEKTLTIGKIGTYLIPKGYYAYVGSAFGSGGLNARINHHLKTVSRAHWHIDYLRKISIPIEIWYTTKDQKLEHYWASIMYNVHAFMPFIQGFGASDCRCKTHLFYSPYYPSFDALELVLSAKVWKVC
ncbi:MAG: GIY-YIG nuclease family protein [bacterium]